MAHRLVSVGFDSFCQEDMYKVNEEVCWRERSDVRKSYEMGWCVDSTGRRAVVPASYGSQTSAERLTVNSNVEQSPKMARTIERPRTQAMIPNVNEDASLELVQAERFVLLILKQRLSDRLTGIGHASALR